MDFARFFKSEKQSLKGFIEKHATLLIFVACVFACSLSFMRQESIDPGNLFFVLALFCGIGGILAYLMNKLWSVKPVFCVLCFIAFALVSWAWLIGLNKSSTRAVYIYVTIFLILIVTFAILFFKGKINAENSLIFIFALGFLIRLTYVLVTSVYTRQHDFYGFNTGDGHGGYISYLFYNNFKLPSDADIPLFKPNMVDQFYHPPFHYFVCALWWKILSLIGVADGYAQESIQMLTLFYSCVCLLLTYKTLKLFNVKGIPMLIGVAIMAFHPTFIIFAGSINNDILSVTFMFTALYLSFKWFKTGKLWDIIFCGVAIGLGMMTKLSAYMICLPVAIIFIIKFIRDFRASKAENTVKGCIKQYALQFGLFLVVCAPLALFWSVRNLVEYDIPISYVQKISTDSWQYVGNHSFFERIFTIKPKEFWGTYSVYDQWTNRGAKLYNEYNPLVSLLKTAMFGEYINNYDYSGITFYADVLFWSNLLIALGGVVAVVFVTIKAFKTKENLPMVVALCSLYVSMVVFYYYFCFAFPHHCSMNIRYVSPLIFAGAMFIALALKEVEKSDKIKFKKIVSYSAISLTSIFSFFANGVFLIISASTVIA